MFVWPHGIAVMPDLSIWTTDAVAPNGVDKNNPGKGHQVLHVDKNGHVLLALARPGVAGASHDTFNAPTDVVIGRNGATATFSSLTGTGREPTPGQFEAPHALAIDTRGRLFIADRPNSRIEIFDQDGNLFAEWKQFGRPSGLAIDKNDILCVTDTQTTKDRPGFENGIYIGSAKDGTVTGFIPKIRPHSTSQGEGPDRTKMEATTVPPDGSAIYGGEAGLRMVVRFIKNK